MFIIMVHTGDIQRMDTRWIDARFEEIETKLLDLHRRMLRLETLLQDEIEEMEESFKKEDKEEKDNDEDEEEENTGGKNAKRRNKQREQEE